MIFDPAGRLLILKPVYKSGWTIPGGVMEIGESPCVDFRPPRRGKPGGLRFLFDCGALPHESFAAMVLQPEEISKYRIEPLPAALDLLRKPIRRRVTAAIGSGGLCYLENGRSVPGVRP
jgi:hypothetical protein